MALVFDNCHFTIGCPCGGGPSHDAVITNAGPSADVLAAYEGDGPTETPCSPSR